MEDMQGVTASPEGSAIPAGESPTPSQGSGAPNEQSSADVQTQPDQGEQPTQPSEDPLAGFPTDEELQAAVASKTPFAEQAARIKSAYEPLKTQFSELENKFKVFEPIQDRFQTPEEVQEIVGLHDKLNAYVRDPDTGKLVPDTEGYVQTIAERDPERADYIAADFMNGLTRTDDGREITRFELALEEIGRNPELKDRRAAALKLLGGVEPSSIAPTWQPTAEELEVVRPELQDIYKSLPYDERENLKLNDPDFINKYLAKEKFQADLMRENETAKQLQARQEQQREQYITQQAESAANKAVEEGFRQGFTEFTQSVVERAKFIAPLDPNSPEAKALPPEQVAQFNQTAQQVNAGVGKFIATVTAALGHPDTAWIAKDFLKEIGVDDKTLQAFDSARLEYARNTRDYGELSFRSNGNGHAGLGTLQSNSQRAMRAMKGQANAVAKPLFELMSKLFEMKAGNYNSTLNGAATARPPVNGQGFNPTTAPAQRPPGGTYSRQEIERMFG